MKLYAPEQEPSKQIPETVTPSPESETFSYRFKNWWYYHKWYVICGAVFIWILGDVIVSALGLREKKPDLQIAYVGSTPLPEDTVAALEQGFAQLAGDFNQDGEALVRVNQFITAGPEQTPDEAFTSYGSEVKLMGDISACESYFFLTDDPKTLQRNFQILANPDGSCPDEEDYSAEGKTVLWSECPALPEMDPGFDLSLGRRCFYSDKAVDSLSQCDELWNTITGTKDVQK